MKVALIGVGHWGRNHLKIYHDMREEGTIEDIVIYDVNKDRLKQLAREFKVTSCRSIKEILNDDEVTMASIVTPSPTHYSISKEFLQARKDVLIEKPLSLDSKEGWELIELSQSLNKILIPGHLFRFHNAINELKRMVQRGDLGDIIKIAIERSAFSVPRSDMGVLHALGIHDVDISCYLLDQQYPLELGAFTTSYYQNYPDEIAIIYQKFSDGATAISKESWLNPFSGKVRTLLTVGSLGAVRINLLVPDTVEIIDTYIEHDENKHYRVINEGTRTKRVSSVEPLCNEIHHFVDCSINETRPMIPAEIGVRSLEMIEMAMLSVKSKRMINVEEYFESRSE